MEESHTLSITLQALFRPVAMMIPDYRLIAEVQLYAAGFQTAGALAAHLVSVLKVSQARLACGSAARQGPVPCLMWKASQQCMPVTAVV